ncbi:DEFECTIVE IN MERISTEM SILENCING 3 protein [Nymphaea thermarum]|nr:DEFECTIVE IN MERISTEM SILENCING 3 protein [Nymphaea thermarum]
MLLEKTTLHLSVFSGETLLFNRKFSILERELKLVSVIPSHCELGSQLENVVFGVVDSVGSIDEEIHGQLHTLTITSGLSNSCDIIHYSFDHGKCKVPAIQLPTQPGNFSFRAFHSRHPELSKTIEVNILMAPKLETVNVSELVDVHQCQYDHNIVPFQNSKDISTFLLYIENDEKPSEFSGDLFLPLFIAHLYSLLSPNKETVGQLKAEQQQSAVICRNQQQSFESLIDMPCVKSSAVYVEQNCVLRASSRSHGYDLSDYIKYTKEHVIKQIEGKSDAASCILHKFLDSSESPNDVMKNVVGIVSLLGTVDNKRLSRMLSEYLGEKYLRAIVCKSYAAGRALERSSTENMDWTLALNREAASCSGTIDKRFFVICLDDISRSSSPGVVCPSPVVCITRRHSVVRRPHCPSPLSLTLLCLAPLCRSSSASPDASLSGASPQLVVCVLPPACCYLRFSSVHHPSPHHRLPTAVHRRLPLPPAASHCCVASASPVAVYCIASCRVALASHSAASVTTVSF